MKLIFKGDDVPLQVMIWRLKTGRIVTRNITNSKLKMLSRHFVLCIRCDIDLTLICIISIKEKLFNHYV